MLPTEQLMRNPALSVGGGRIGSELPGFYSSRLTVAVLPGWDPASLVDKQFEKRQQHTDFRFTHLPILALSRQQVPALMLNTLSSAVCLIV